MPEYNTAPRWSALCRIASVLRRAYCHAIIEERHSSVLSTSLNSLGGLPTRCRGCRTGLGAPLAAGSARGTAAGGCYCWRPARSCGRGACGTAPRSCIWRTSAWRSRSWSCGPGAVCCHGCAIERPRWRSPAFSCARIDGPSAHTISQSDSRTLFDRRRGRMQRL